MAGLRADARHNRDHILTAARDAFIDQGVGTPLDEIAQRAGVAIATLRRRFADRHALQRAVALDVWARLIEETERAGDEEPDAFGVLVRYMHRGLELRAGSLFPALAPDLDGEDDIARAREEAAGVLRTVVATAHEEGTLRSDIDVGDIGLMLVRLGRSLAHLPRCGRGDRAASTRCAHRWTSSGAERESRQTPRPKALLPRAPEHR